MNNPSYETFIRICQDHLININGTSPHFSNRFSLLASAMFPPPLLLLLLLPNPLLPITASPPSMCIFNSHFILPPASLSCLTHPFTLMISSTLTPDADSVPVKSVPPLLPPPLPLDPVSHLHPLPPLFYLISFPPSLFLLTPAVSLSPLLIPLLPYMVSISSLFAFLCRWLPPRSALQSLHC